MSTSASAIKITDECLLCFGYIHDNILKIKNEYQLDLLFPDGIIMIIMHYFEKYFEWDPENCANGIKLSNDNTIAECTSNTNRLLISKNVISAAKYNKVEWEITMKLPHRICIAFGFVEYPLSKSINNVENSGNFLDEDYNHSVYIHDLNVASDSCFDICDGNKDIQKITSKNPGDFKDDDTLKLIFDFVERKCEFYCNDEFMGVILDDMDDKTEWIPAMACNKPHTFECTQWNCQHKFLKYN